MSYAEFSSNERENRKTAWNTFTSFLLPLPLCLTLIGINQCEDQDTDDDGDGWTENDGDCNDADVNIHPGQTETCDGIDQDCDNQVDEGLTSTYYPDDDGDGYGRSNAAAQACSQPDGYVTAGGDCDDDNEDINPAATEVCDGVDNDCDSQTDEGVKTTYYQDRDGDGYGNPNVTTQACTTPSGYVTAGGDCNDSDSTAYPGGVESCDGVDDDCDGTVDDGVTSTYYLDNDADGYGLSNSTRQACSQPSGYASQSGDCNDQDSSIHPGATDDCSDEVDNDCDGSSGEGSTTSVDAESNNTMGTAIDLGTLDNTTTTCKTVTGQLLGGSDVDYYKFYSIDQLNDNWSLSAALTPPEGVSYCVDLINENGEVWDSECKVGTNTAYVEETFVPYTATDYYWVKIYPDTNETVCASYSATICGY